MNLKKVLFLYKSNYYRSDTAEMVANTLFGDDWEPYIGVAQPAGFFTLALDQEPATPDAVSSGGFNFVTGFRYEDFDMVITLEKDPPGDCKGEMEKENQLSRRIMESSPPNACLMDMTLNHLEFV